MTELLNHRLQVDGGGKLDPQRLPPRAGVYLFEDADRRPILLATAGNLRRAIRHRWAAGASQAKTKRSNLAEITRSISWRESFSRFETTWIHWQAARALHPETYRRMISFPPAWFLQVAPAAEFPRFCAVKTVRADASIRTLGPFAGRRSAEKWAALLDDLFDLCRYPHILEQAPHGEACAYADMGKCPAPCDGRLSMEAYRDMVAAAIDFSCGTREPRISQLRAAMNAAADRLAFERAASIRQTLGRAEAMIGRKAYKHIADAMASRWFILQRGGPTRRTARSTLIKAFYVRPGAVTESDPASLAEIETVLPRWIETFRSQSDRLGPPAPDPATLSETLWLVARFVLQEDRAAGLFYRQDGLPSPSGLVEALHERFLPPPKDRDPARPSGH